MHDPQFNLFVLYTHDLDRTVRFYQALGLVFTKHQHGSGPAHYAADQETFVFEIYPTPQPHDPVGHGRFGFRVTQLDACVATLLVQGAQIISSPRPSPWGRRAVLADPDGYRLELIEHAHPHAAS